MTPAPDTDVLIVGGGPAGASTAIRLARAGHHVTLLEKRLEPRHKSCGDLLTPRAVAELDQLGVDPAELGAHLLHGMRIRHGQRSSVIPWPAHPSAPPHAFGLRRNILDEHLRRTAAAAGAVVLMGHEAAEPIIDRGFVRGAVTIVESPGAPDAVRTERRIRARFVVVADGANSAFGRSLGTTRERRWPYGVSTRTYFASDRSAESWIDTELALAGPNGAPLAGFGWVTPLGDGTVNVGIGMLSTSNDVISVNALRLLDVFARSAAEAWGFDPDEMLKAPTRFRLPLGGSVGPKMGPTFLLVGDAGGLANPLDGDGVDAALLSARIAADVLDDALRERSSTALQRYPTLLADEIGRYHHVGRLAARFLGRPFVLAPFLAVASRSERVMGAAVRVATNELRSAPGEAGGAERAYRLASIVSRAAPSW